jgi:(5-formylfuran-3-yl)methyl phosphate synthase
MTLMLASVTGPDEAEIALAGGADIIDLKDPARGAFGAVSAEVIRATFTAVRGRRPLSAVAGELAMDPARIVAIAELIADTGVDYLKLGVFPGGDPESCFRALAPLAERVRLVGVLFADRAPDFCLLPLLARNGFHAAMLDTADKSNGRLLDHMDLPRLRQFVVACRTQRLIAGLAGALEAPDVPRLLVLAPGVLGFRGALCGAVGRSGRIDPDAVQAIRALIPPESAEPGLAVDYRLLAARGYAADSTADPTQTDRIFVRDFVVPVRIGAYAREREAPQPVRFSVEAVVARPAYPNGGRDAGAPARTELSMRDVFSYDLIRDGIRMLVDAGHVAFVETLAERIAAMVLAHPLVRKVAVQVEKLAAGSGTVGVAIERTRETAIPSAGQLFAGMGLPTPEGPDSGSVS